MLEFFQLLNSDFLDIRLPDIGWHPAGGIGGLWHLFALTLEDMYLLGSPLPKPDVGEAAVCRLQGSLSGLLSGKYSNLVSIRVSQCEIPFFYHNFIPQT